MDQNTGSMEDGEDLRKDLLAKNDLTSEGVGMWSQVEIGGECSGGRCNLELPDVYVALGVMWWGCRVQRRVFKGFRLETVRKKLLALAFLFPFSLASIYFDIANLHRAHGKTEDPCWLGSKTVSIIIPSSKKDSG